MEKENPDCGGCGNDGCGSCGGCAQKSNELLLCREEIIILEELGQFAFLPLLTKREGDRSRYAPVDNALSIDGEHFSEAIESLLWKKLIALDETLPIENLDYGAAAQAPGASCGSVALTLQGQEAITLLDLATWTE